MKKLILLLILISAIMAFAQPAVKTVPNTHSFEKLYRESVGYLLLGDGADGVDTSLAVSARDFEGDMTLSWVSDTTGASVKAANKSDSSLTIGIQFKNKNYDGMTNDGWGPYYNDSDTYKGIVEYSKLDTLDRAYVNVAQSVFRYVSLGRTFDDWALADSIRFIFFIGVGDSLKGYPEIIKQ
jgi:hypothetical protein